MLPNRSVISLRSGVAVILVFYALLFVAFDPIAARVHGVRAGLMEALFNLLTAAVVIVSVRVLGVLLESLAPSEAAGMAARIVQAGVTDTPALRRIQPDNGQGELAATHEPDGHGTTDSVSGQQ